MSFCRITGKSRGLPKPNYFPILPPISPADAKRLCRITNKSQGLPSHHYIPALAAAINLRTHCKVTAKSEGQGPHHYPNMDDICKPHVLIPGYKYVFPKFDEDEKNQKSLLKLMSLKDSNDSSNIRYVYCVEEKKTNLVIPAGLEAAVRDGDVRDVMLGQEGDTILIKMYHGPNVTVNVDNFIMNKDTVMFDGMGPSEEVLARQMAEKKEKDERKAKNIEALKSRKKIFEDREKLYDKEDMENASIEERRKAKLLQSKLLEKERLKNRMHNLSYIKEQMLSDTEACDPVFGHIVQTSESFSFYPGASIVDLPEGKIIPGRLEKKDNGVKFVPGMMFEEKFVPGQMVVTNNGEEFVPGQVIETREGPKFVPGQMVETSTGPKFVPGQTIMTENGPEFVPGQIIQTKAGPTFIPGQIIVTGHEAKFVPGRVIETVDGPCFVPGRVIETGDQVIFVSGQVVETPEGLRFVASDLENATDGVQEYSVQGFEVTPEELKLLRPTYGHFACDSTASINSEMLRQLSEAGMSLGRQISSELPRVDVRSLPLALEKLNLSGEPAAKMTQIVWSLAQIALKVNRLDESCTSSVNLNDVGVELVKKVEESKNLEKYLRVIVASSLIECRKHENLTEEELMVAVSLALENTLKEASTLDDISIEKVIESVNSYLKSPENLNQIRLEVLNYLEICETLEDQIKFVTDVNSEPNKVIKKISKILNENMSEGFKELFSNDSNLVAEVIKQISQTQEVTSKSQLENILQNAIVSVVKEKTEKKLINVLSGRKGKRQQAEGEGDADAEVEEEEEEEDFENLLQQAIGLAKALGMSNTASKLMVAATNPAVIEMLCNDSSVKAILQKLMVMHQIAKTKPKFANALKKLTVNSKAAKSDSSVRELLRCSTALMAVPQKNLESSAEIPLSLLLSSNNLAIEDYLSNTKRPKILLILKSGLQAVVPREAARAVLTGKVPYAVMDEKGIKYFEPLHVFSTMKLPKYAARCFTMYCCPEIDYRVQEPKINLNGITPTSEEY